MKNDTPDQATNSPSTETYFGDGGEIHQISTGEHTNLTTNQGMVVSDDHNSLRAGPRGPVLLEDFILREKIFHFDHERIPERVVHARGLAAHGYFELTHSLASLTSAEVLSETGVKIPVFTRFSTVAGNKGSADLARDVRGFAVKFYTQQGNWDLVGNNIPVFFIQDAMKFPDLAHAVKEEPDRGFPQAASAHDTFWDWIAMTPEAMHMVMWQMSDRTIPRSVRMMQGFGVHSFRLVDGAGKTTFVKFHWLPKLGLQSVLWDEAVKINGADPDFHRRDLYDAIEAGDYPEWELAVQLFSEDDAAEFDFDHLDATKLIPEEIIPLQVIGRMVLNRNPANVFAETEQVAYCTQNLVPGIDFSDDPLLHGRNFSYLDTQLSRLGSTNFNQIPINAPKCPFANMQRDGHMQTHVQPQRVTYTPSLLDPSGPRENRDKGFKTFQAPLSGIKQRERSETFSDHYSQARQFFLSQKEVEQNHIIAALIFELSKVQSLLVRSTMLGHLIVIDEKLAARVADGLGHVEAIIAAVPASPVRTDLPRSATLSLLTRSPATIKGRTIGILLGEGASGDLLASLTTEILAAQANYKIICNKIGGVTLSDGMQLAADMHLAGAPSVFFDAVALIAPPVAVQAWLAEAAAISWVQDAYAHLKVIAACPASQLLLQRADVVADDGIIAMTDSATGFVDAVLAGRNWDREPKVRSVF
jgi:catalase